MGRPWVCANAAAHLCLQYVHHFDFRHWLAFRASPVAMGGFWGLSPPCKAPSPQNWNTKHYESVEFLSIFSVKPPRTNAKPPPQKCKAALLKTFWRRFCFGRIDHNGSHKPDSVLSPGTLENGDMAWALPLAFSKWGQRGRWCLFITAS